MTAGILDVLDGLIGLLTAAGIVGDNLKAVLCQPLGDAAPNASGGSSHDCILRHFLFLSGDNCPGQDGCAAASNLDLSP